MNAISMMELNAKSPLFWDWENLVMPNNNTNTNTNPTTKGVDVDVEVEAPPKKLHFVVDSNIDAMEGFDPEPGSFYSSGLGSGSGSDLGYVSSSKSSKSGSTDSGCGSDLGHVNSGESLIALELGKRTFFEAGSSNRKTSVPLTSSAAKKIKPSSLSNDQNPRCQVEGCNLDLSSAKDYHRKHRVCENHSKSPKVVINGLERRFCQQCSRFHSLSEFDQKKRSCRRRLSDHNARRRKPKPEVIQFNSTSIASSLYESRNQLSFAFNQAPGSIRAGHSAWTIPRDTPAKPGLFTIMKPGCADELHSAQNGIPNPDTKLSSISVSTNLLPSKVSPSDKVFQRGIGSGSMAPQANNMDGAQDLRALSLLSTTSWGSSCEPSPAPSPSLFNQPSSMHQANQASLPQPTPAINTIPLGGGGVSSEYWQPPPISSGPPSSAFQLFKDPNESSFYLY